MNRKLVEIINEFGNVARYKINTQKSLEFLYTNMKDQKEIKEMIAFTITSKTVKYLRINLLKEAKDLYSDHYEMLVKKIKDDTGTWSDIPHS